MLNLQNMGYFCHRNSKRNNAMSGCASTLDKNDSQNETVALGDYARTSLNPHTQLSTDFLNQFNEIAMILEMLTDWPEGLDDLYHWQPRGYIEHFKKSGFHDAENVIAAYQNTPCQIRTRLDAHIQELDGVIKVGLGSLFKASKLGMNESVSEAGRALAIEVQNAVMRLSRIINTSSTGTDQQKIDSLIAEQF